MVHFYVFNPAEKLRLLSRVLCWGSKRLLRNANVTPTPPARPCKVKSPCFIDADPCAPSSSELVRDAEYYKEDFSGGFYVFRVENTLFKVHRSFLMRESSAFSDMFSIPNCNHHEGTRDELAIPLSDTAQQFRDFLWALYALPNELCLSKSGTSDAETLERWVNVAEMMNKYCFASFESWAVDRIYSMAQNPVGFLRSASPVLCARVLNISVLCNHRSLLDLVTQRLVPRMLWSSIEIDPILEVAERYGMKKLLGVAYYKQLVGMEQVSCDGTSSTQPVFPSSMDIEKQMHFLAAHQSLMALWEQLQASPPIFESHGCSSHDDCIATWKRLWSDAGIATQALCFGSTNIFDKLKFMMMYLRKATAETSSMSLQCTLTALEAITMIRDEVTDGLLDHFTIL